MIHYNSFEQCDSPVNSLENPPPNSPVNSTPERSEYPCIPQPTPSSPLGHTGDPASTKLFIKLLQNEIGRLSSSHQNGEIQPVLWYRMVCLQYTFCIQTLHMCTENYFVCGRHSPSFELVWRIIDRCDLHFVNTKNCMLKICTGSAPDSSATT